MPKKTKKNTEAVTNLLIKDLAQQIDYLTMQIAPFRDPTAKERGDLEKLIVRVNAQIGLPTKEDLEDLLSRLKV